MMAIKVILAGLAIIFGLWSLYDSFLIFYPMAQASETTPVPPFWLFPKLVIAFLSMAILILV